MSDSKNLSLDEYIESIEADDFVKQSKNKISEILKGLNTLKNKLINKKDEFSIPIDRTDDFVKLFAELENVFLCLKFH